MAAPPTSTKTSLQQRLSARARDRWPQLAGVDVRFRGAFAYVTATMPDGDRMPLMRLRYGGSAARWGFAVYLASKDGYEDSVLPTATWPAHPKRPHTACGLYLGDPTAPASPPINLRARPLSESSHPRAQPRKNSPHQGVHKLGNLAAPLLFRQGRCTHQTPL